MQGFQAVLDATGNGKADVIERVPVDHELGKLIIIPSKHIPEGSPRAGA